MEKKKSHVDIRNLDKVDSAHHQKLLLAFAELEQHMQQMINEIEAEPRAAVENESLKCDMWKILENYNYAMQGVDIFIRALTSESTVLNREIEQLEAKRQEYLTERDILIEKGHELNCRIGYNALERKLDESFTSIEKYNNEASAKCFRDEAEENLKQTNNLIRIANIRACQIDRDTFKEMEKITTLFESYEKDREYYVKELDLFSDMKRNKILLCLSEPCLDTVREKGENILDYLNLSQKQRHMEAQVIKNALRMYSFNASLNFDREDNLKMMEELFNLQNKIHKITGSTIISPRNAKAKLNLTIEDPNNNDEGNDETLREQDDSRGRGLHRCPRNVNLATDPVTDPKLVTQLEAVLKWDETTDTPPTTCDLIDGSISEPHSLTITSSSLTMTDAKHVFSLCGDAEAAHVRPTFASIVDENGCLVKTDSKPMNSFSSAHSFLSHLESSTGLPGSEKQMIGLVRKKHNTRPVGSLTNVLDNEKTMLSSRDHESPPRDTRSQSSEHPRPSFSSNKSREHVTNSGSGGD